MPNFPKIIIRQSQISETGPAAVESDLSTIIVGPMAETVNYLDSGAFLAEYGNRNIKTSEFASANNPYALDVIMVNGKVKGGESTSILLFDSLKIYAYGEIGSLILVTTATANNSVQVTLGSVTGVKAGDYLVIDNSGSGVDKRLILAVDATTKKVTINGAAVTLNNATVRVERISSAAFLVNPNYIYQSTTDINTVKVYSGLTDPAGYVIVFAKLYNSFSAIKTGTFQIGYIDNINTIEDKIGKINENNLLAMGVYVAKSNTPTTRVYYLPVTASASYSGGKWSISYDWAGAIDTLSKNKNVYRVVPLTTDLATISLFKTEAESSSMPSIGIYRIVYGSLDIPVTSELASSSTGGVSNTPETNEIYNTIEIDGGLTITTPGDYSSYVYGAEDLAYMGLGTNGYKVKIISSNPAYNGVVYEVERTIYSSTGEPAVVTLDKVRVKESVADSSVDLTGATLEFYDLEGNLVLSGTADVSITKSLSYYNEFTDTGVNFLTAGVSSGDYIEFNLPISNTYDPSVLFKHSVKAVNKSIKLKISSVSSNSLKISITDNSIRDLPYLYFVNKNGDRLTNVSYKVIRQNDSDQIKTILINAASSLNSKRAKLIVPVTGTVDIPLLNLVKQSPMYLACAIAGYKDSLPVHQGMTHLGIPLISLPSYPVYISNADLETLSNGGIDLYVQQNEISQPYSLHQLTTSQSGYFFDEETSDVETLDGICRAIKAILMPYIGVFNLTPMTLNLLAIAINNVLELYEKSIYPRIGSAIVSHTYPVIEKSNISGNAVGYVSVALHEPLNVIDLTIGY